MLMLFAPWRTVGIGLLIVALTALGILKWAKNIRDLLGIPNDALAAKKTKLEVAKMESAVVTPTMDEVILYDSKRQALIKAAKKDQALTEYALIWVLVFLLGLVLVIDPLFGERIQSEFVKIVGHLS